MKNLRAGDIVHCFFLVAVGKVTIVPGVWLQVKATSRMKEIEESGWQTERI